MPQDAPGGWELKRDVNQMRSDLKDGFASLNLRFDDMAKSMVSSREHANDMARMRERHAELALNLMEERDARKEALESEATARKEALESEAKARKEAADAQTASLLRTGLWVRWVATGLLIPTLVPLALYVMNRGS